ncbi:type I restriction endonuclease [Halostreptopolyspora alba]|uniref:Restriction endonuclease n=1 Tax=Halostreptopolyspora alba TaxID=2487137 RepID=A0A3N0E3P0_9ACTN|nr:restriction endonuclease [Nocardiopsaceae bacterium YIM 96095]
MELNERIAALSAKVRKQRDSIRTEEAAKNAFVMPFISSVLGYDVFDPHEVVPEFTADIGVKQSEKVDYAILHGGEVQVLVECKKSSEPLRIEHAKQLYRYFTVTNARIGVLTNGVEYEFYTDLDSPNRMDARPFLVLNLSDVDETLLPELRKLTKENFDLGSVLDAAGELKYIGEIKRTLAAQFRDPADDWIRFFVTRVHEGAFTKKVREQFTPLVLKAASQYLDDQVNERLRSALASGSSESQPETERGDGSTEESTDSDSEIITTLEELEGYHIVKAIACSEVRVRPERIVYRDSKSYFAILMDDNNRKPIVRLRFNGKTRKYIGTFDSEKNETRHLISSPEEIYEHTGAIRDAVRNYLE